jgi:hypothetical protein
MKSLFKDEAMIFRNDNNGRISYSTTISKKNPSGEWEQAYIGIQFKNGVNFQNRAKIQIQEAWLSFYKTKDGKAVFYIFCNKFSQAAEDENQDSQVPEGFQALEDDDDIPF